MRYIYTLRTKSDMAVFYVGCCDTRMCRVAVHRNASSTRPVSVRIRELEEKGEEIVTVIEEAIEPSDVIRRHWSFVEKAYICGYAELLREKLTNVVGNSYAVRKSRPFIDQSEARAS